MRYWLWESNSGIAIVVLSVVFAGSVYIFLTRRGAADISRKNATFILVGLILWICLEFFLGKYAPIYWDDEGGVVPPLLNYIAKIADERQILAHEFAGGLDRYAMILTGSQYFSLDIFLTKFLPMWAVVLVNKLLSVSLGVVGMYLTCRKVGHVSRYGSLAVAFLFYSIDSRYIDQTLIFGTSWGALPAICFLTAHTLGRSLRSFFAAVFITAFLFSSLPPTHMGLAAGATWMIAAIFFYRGPAWRPLAGFAILVAATVLNWHEVIWAFLQVSAQTKQMVSTAAQSWRADQVFAITPLMLASCFAILILFVYRDRLCIAFAAAAAAAFTAYAAVKFVLIVVPGLDALHSARWSMAGSSLNVFGLLVIARSIKYIDSEIINSFPIKKHFNFTALICAFCIYMSLYYKGNHFFELVHVGGYAHFTSIGNLKNRAWESTGLYRVVTLRLRQPEPNIPAGFYGLDTFDATVNLVPRMLHEYWHHGIKKAPPADSLTGPTIDVKYRSWSFDRLEYDLNAEVRTRFLRAVNVQYVLSPIPIKEDGLHLVSGPTFPRKLHGVVKNWEEKRDYYAWRFGKIRDFGNIYIYKLADAVPRAYGAGSVVTLAKAADLKAEVHDGAEAALSRRVLIRAPMGHDFASFQGPVEVKDVQKTVEGYFVSVNASRNGAVVLNVPHSTFWKAKVDGVSVPVVRANFIQMAVALPAGAKEIRFIYDRPFLKETLFPKLFGAKSN